MPQKSPSPQTPIGIIPPPPGQPLTGWLTAHTDWSRLYPLSIQHAQLTPNGKFLKVSFQEQVTRRRKTFVERVDGDVGEAFEKMLCGHAWQEFLRSVTFRS